MGLYSFVHIIYNKQNYHTLSVQSLSSVQLFVTPWTAAHQASLSITKLPELAQTHVHRVGDAIQPSHPLSSPFPPAFNLSQHKGLFWSFSFSISPSSEYAGLISFRIHWLDLLAVQDTFKSLLQHQSSKASIILNWRREWQTASVLLP